MNSLDEASRIVNFYLQGSAVVVRSRVDDGFLVTEEPRGFPNNCGARYWPDAHYPPWRAAT